MAPTTPPAGSYAYCLNMAITDSLVIIVTNSKRVLRDFRLTGINCALSTSNIGNWSCILGTEHENWFAGFVRAETIFGNGVFPHLLPVDANRVIEKGDYIVCQAINLEATAKRIALIFQGVHI